MISNLNHFTSNSCNNHHQLEKKNSHQSLSQDVQQPSVRRVSETDANQGVMLRVLVDNESKISLSKIQTFDKSPCADDIVSNLLNYVEIGSKDSLSILGFCFSKENIDTAWLDKYSATGSKEARMAVESQIILHFELLSRNTAGTAAPASAVE